jgi:streptomycin 6-kinase
VIVCTMFNPYLERWGLMPDGEPIITPTSRLLPVRLGNVPAVLKIAILDEERAGGLLMTWWNGRGAAPVLAHEDNAILMERAKDGPSLAEIARSGRDDEASRIICSVLAKLHTPRGCPAPALLSLREWFEPLLRAPVLDGILRCAATTASHLLANQRDTVVLHGDIHHGNILNFGLPGWLAIDPKGLVGERSFDYANIFCNPDQETATMPGRLLRQTQVVAQTAQLPQRRLLAWILAWAGLSAAFSINDRLSPDDALGIAELAAMELSH